MLLTGMREGSLEGDGQVSAGGQIKELFAFPAVESLVVDLNPAIVLSTENAVGVQLHDQPIEFLVIQLRIAHEAHGDRREEGTGDANSPLDLSVLTDKVQRIAEPVGVGDGGHSQIGHGGGVYLVNW